jgi:ABC-type multidrug transport system permease subunit
VRLPRFWSNVLAVAYREALVLRHDRALIVAVIAQPIMMLVLFGVALSNKPAHVPWAVVDRSHTAVSRRLVATIQETGYFLPPRPIGGYAEGRALLRGGAALAVLVVPEDFARDVERGRPRVQLLLDGSDPLSSARVASYVTQVAAALTPGDASSRVRRPTRVANGIDVRQRFWFNPTLADRNFFLAALAGMLLTNLCLSATSLGLVGERESGTWEQMLSQPTRPLEIVLGKVAPYAVVAYLVLTFATVAAGAVFGVWPEGSWVTLYVVSLPYILASLAVGVLVSALARTSAQSVFISVFFILPSFVLSGVMMPYQFMPAPVRAVGALFPLRWYQIASRRIIERGASFADVVVPMLALIGLFAVILAMIRWRMKPRLG